MPRVSVVMNCFNGERFVRQAIDSVYAQTFKDWEIIFWDNASTDSTPQIAHIYDTRLRYFRSAANVPLGLARRLAMAEALGDWVAFVDHDDFCLPERFARQMAAIGSTDYAASYAGIRNVDENGRTISDRIPQNRSGLILNRQLRHFEANLQTMMLNTSYLRKYGIELDETYRTAEDYYLFMRVAAKGPVCVIPEVLAIYRIWQDSLSERTLHDLAEERRRTHALLQEEPAIGRTFAADFAVAEFRNVYYDARYAMHKGRHVQARKLMRTIRSKSLLYFTLWTLSFLPSLWKFAHTRSLKIWLTNKILGM